MNAGDVFLYSGIDHGDRIIRWATRSPWSHCGVIVSPQGGTIEALSTGVARCDIGRLDAARVRIVPLDMEDDERERGLRWLGTVVGRRYGFVGIASVALSLVTGSHFFFGLDGTMTCSVVVAKYLSRVGLGLEMDDDRVRPSDIAAAFDLGGE